MTCDSAVERDLHEKYALGRLSGDELATYEAHLAGCAACSRALEEERLLIGGLKAIGRSELKAEIRRQAAAGPHRDNMQLLMRAAAVLLAIALIPVIYFYFAPVIAPDIVLQETDRPLLVKEEQTIEPLADEAPAEMWNDDIAGLGAQAGAEEVKKDSREDPIEGSPAMSANQPVAAAAKSRVSSGVRTSGDLEAEVAADRDESRRAATPRERLNVLQPGRPLSSGEALQFSTESPAAGAGYGSLGKAGDAAGEALLDSGPGGRRSRLSGDNIVRLGNARRQVTIQFQHNGQARSPQAEDTAIAYPDSFPVSILSRDSLNLILNWYVDQAEVAALPESLWAEFDAPQRLRVQINRGNAYHIDLKHDSTRAVLEKDEDLKR